MKIKTLLLIITFVFTNNATYSQYKIDWAKTPVNPIPVEHTLNHNHLKGDVKKFTINGFFGESVYNYDKKGQLDSDTGEYSGYTKYYYDSNGHLYNSINELDIGTVTTNFKTNRKGWIVEKIYSDGSGGLQFAYNSDGLWISTTVMGENRVATAYRYDGLNRVILKEQYDKNNKVTLSTIYSYTKENDITKVKEFISYPEGIPQTLYSYYDAKGNSLGSSGTYYNKYDAKDNWYQLVNSSTKNVFSRRNITYFSNSSSSKKSPKITPPQTSKNTEGCISGNCKNGWGKKKFSHGTYTGFWSNSIRNGYGMFVWNNEGGKYIGFWEKAKMTGYGVFIGVNQDMIGQYKNGFIQGLGYIVKDDDFKYGEYKLSQLEKEYAYYSNSGVSIGCVSGNCVNQYGKMVWENGDSFIGFFKNGNMFMGTYEFSSGDKYEGMFNNSNQFHGQGRFFFKDGGYYAGEWDKGKYNGLGYFLDKDLNEKKGEWRNGTLQKSI